MRERDRGRKREGGRKREVTYEMIVESPFIILNYVFTCNILFYLNINPCAQLIHVFHLASCFMALDIHVQHYLHNVAIIVWS